MNDAERAAEWMGCLKNVSGRDLAWHLEGVLKSDGEKVLNEVLKRLEIRSAADLVRRAA